LGNDAVRSGVPTVRHIDLPIAAGEALCEAVIELFDAQLWRPHGMPRGYRLCRPCNALRAASVGGEPDVTITSDRACTSSAASFGSVAGFPSAKRKSKNDISAFYPTGAAQCLFKSRRIKSRRT
jgi:hypothetical protein